MKCPQCGAWTEVRETRGAVRRRECANLHRFTTEEVVRESQESKDERRRRVAEEPGSVAEVSRRLGIPESTIRDWRKKYLQEKE